MPQNPLEAGYSNTLRTQERELQRTSLDPHNLWPSTPPPPPNSDSRLRRLVSRVQAAVDRAEGPGIIGVNVTQSSDIEAEYRFSLRSGAFTDVWLSDTQVESDSLGSFLNDPLMSHLSRWSAAGISLAGGGSSELSGELTRFLRPDPRLTVRAWRTGSDSGTVHLEVIFRDGGFSEGWSDTLRGDYWAEQTPAFFRTIERVQDWQHQMMSRPRRPHRSDRVQVPEGLPEAPKSRLAGLARAEGRIGGT